MNDKKIINTISKINFIILSIVLFIVLILSSIFLLLKNGIYFDYISVSNVEAKKLYIKWDSNINIIADELIIKNNTQTKKKKKDYSTIITLLDNSTTLLSLLEEISIKKLSVNGSNGSLNYTTSTGGTLYMSTKDYNFESSFVLKDDIIDVKRIELANPKKKLNVKGNLLIDNTNKLNMHSSFNINISDDTILNLYAISDAKRLSYSLASTKDINNTKLIVDLFDMNPRAKYWLYDAMEMSSLSLKSAKGYIEYDNVKEAYKNIHVKAVANDLVYTYDKKSDSVRTSHTNLEFKDGVLYIRPKNALSYNFFLDKSWLKIDFSKQEELLTLFLKFKGKVNDDLHTLLNRYNIKLPFTQTQGNMDADLKLDINLITKDVEAVGDFKTAQAQINYLGLDLDIFDVHVQLENSNVKVKNMYAKYKEIASAHVDLDFNAKKSKGSLKFKVDKLEAKEFNLKLSKDSIPLSVTYNISSKKDYIDVEKSAWIVDNKTFNITQMKIPFDMKTLSANIPSTTIKSHNLLSASATGKLQFKPLKANIDLNLLSFNYKDIKLNQDSSNLAITYDKKLTLSSHKPIKLKVDNKKVTLNNVALDIDSESIKAHNLGLNIDRSLKSKINVNYNLTKGNGYIDPISIKYTDSELGEIINAKHLDRVFIYPDNEKTYFKSNTNGFEYTHSDKGWSLSLASLKKVFKYSGILRKYELDNGSIFIKKPDNSKNIEFTIKSKYKYKVLAKDSKPVDNYTLHGFLNMKTEKIILNLNNRVQITVDDEISINANDIGINLYQVLNLLDDEMMKNANNKSPKVSFKSKNSHIYFSESRSAISEKLNMSYHNKLLIAELIYKEGTAYFKSQDNDFYIYGENFNDEFIEKLLSHSEFNGGTLEFSIDGTYEEYVGSVYLKDTTIRNYTVLNNVLAFVNTIPSLVTFSLPGYNRKGLKADSAYMNFKFKDDVYHINDLFLHSQELDIIGKGQASIKNNSIHLDLNLKTDLGSSLSQIPVVGYILFGDESVSSSLTVTGALDDPDVNTRIAKDIAVAPLNIIKRTFMFPYELFRDKKEKKK